MIVRSRVWTLALLAVAGSLIGCTNAQRPGQAVAGLTSAEIDYLKTVRDRAAEDHKALAAGLAQLQLLTRDYMVDEESLALNVAKARLLDSLQSVFKKSGDAVIASTQKAIALYLMYDLEQAQRAAFDVKVQAARASVLALGDTQDQFKTLLDQAIQNETVILAELNAPPSQQAASAATEFLNQVTAFQKELATSDNPKLKAMATKVAAAEDKVSQAKARIDQVMLSINFAKEKLP